MNHAHSLFINVWAPANNTTTTNPALPVKVWLYGGGNAAGGISNPTYDGCTAVASQDSVIQVSINYRLGPLGFLYSRSLGLTGNQGVQDQLLGLRWVQDNIGAFGGDPSRVLLFGQSAGAFDAFVISSLPQAPSLVSAVALESGAGIHLLGANAAQARADALAGALNCGAADAACVRAAPVSALLAAYAGEAAAAAVPGSSVSSALGLVVDGDVVAAQPLEAGLKVPALAGSTTDEGTLFLLARFLTAILEVNATTYDDFLTSTFGTSVEAQRVNQTYALSKYPGLGAQPVISAMSAIITHSQFRCPTRRFLRRAVEAGMPVWTYRYGVTCCAHAAGKRSSGVLIHCPNIYYSFNHTLTCPWYPTIPSAALTLLGSTHTAEIPFVFGGTDGLPRPNGNCSLTDGEKALSAKMLAAWDSMASSADPGSGWPRYDSSSSMGINVVGDEFEAAVVDYSMCDFWDSFDSSNSTSGGGATSNGTESGPSSSGAVTSSRLEPERRMMAWVLSFALMLLCLGG